MSRKVDRREGRTLAERGGMREDGSITYGDGETTKRNEVEKLAQQRKERADGNR